MKTNKKIASITFKLSEKLINALNQEIKWLNDNDEDITVSAFIRAAIIEKINAKS